MKGSRLRFSAAAVLAVAALSLTACGPDSSSDNAGSAATTGPASTAGPAGTTQPTAPEASGNTTPVKPVSAGQGSSKQSSAKPTRTTPSDDCTARAAGVGRVVEATENGYLTHIWMRAKPTKFICGPDVPDDGYFEGYGTPTVFTFDNNVKTSLLNGVHEQQVDLNTFMKHMDDCLNNQSAVTAPYHCSGNQYVIKANGQNVITSISELYHP
ncbi:hypothetical protein [Kitasatospora sp. HPMI-4]|uniref:hypothetical protein n=1 Tax=Kitasatospora sp. HPMI-4 TaxID=3448443 RepID=UPI003F1D6F6B